MKFCHMPFDYLYLDHYNGNVYLCPWMEPSEGKMGNILEDDFREIWNGEKAEQLRNTVRTGTFSLCRSVACPHIQNNDLPEVSVQELSDLCVAEETPGEINLAFDFICNQSCPTCRCEVFKPDADYDRNVGQIIDRILPYIAKARKITASGHGDPFASPYMMNLLENLHPESKNMEIWLETNGVLFDEEHWKRIEHLSECNLQIITTTNSYNEALYNQISRGGNLEKLKRNQLFLKSLREQGKVRHTTNAFVIQEKNYWEIPEFIRRSIDEFGFDEVILRPVYNWGNLTKEEYWFKDVLNPCHPYHEEYKKIINLPIVKDNPRVYNFGGDTDHKAMPMPGCESADYKKFKDYFVMFKKWIQPVELNKRLELFMKTAQCRSFLIYGAGDVGRALARELRKMEIDLRGFVDKYQSNCFIDDIEVYKCDDKILKETDAIIVTPIHEYSEIEKELKEQGFAGKVFSVLEALG